MYLVDTSVWVDYIRGRDRFHVRFLRDLLSNPLAVSITPLICMEILQGARDPASYDRLHSYFGGQRFVDFDRPLDGHAAAARLYLDCRRRGVTVRSSLDCLIAQCAIESELTLFHHDRDFRNIASVVPSLKEMNYLDSVGPSRDTLRIEDRPMTPYESWLRAACKNALIPGYLERPVNDLLDELREKPEFWRMWVNKTGGNPYPPRDARNEQNNPDSKLVSPRGFRPPIPGAGRFTDPITYSLMWDKDGNLIYPKTRKAQLAALRLEVKKETNADGSLTGKGRLCQAQLDYLLSRDE